MKLLKDLKAFLSDWNTFRRCVDFEYIQNQLKLNNEILNIVNNNLKLANRMQQINLSTQKLHENTFSPFKCKHREQDIVIVATGPSASKYIPIENAIHIGVNRAFQLGKVDFEYYFIQDYSGMTKEYIDDLNNYRKNECIKFYGLTTEWEYEPNRTIPETHAYKANALRYRTDWGNIPYFEPQFSYDILTQPLGCFGSVVFPALQFALWTYPKRIYLVGCDCTLAGYAYDGKSKNFLIPSEIISAYKKFKEFSHKYYPDIEIISINPVGLKGIFKDEYQDANC